MSENKNLSKSESVESVQSDLELRQKARAELDRQVIEEIKQVFEIVPKAKKVICSECMRVFPYVKSCTIEQMDELDKRHLHLIFTEKYFDKKVRCQSCYFEKFSKINEAHNLAQKEKLSKKLIKLVKPVFLCPSDHYKNEFKSREELRAHLVSNGDCLRELEDQVKNQKEEKRRKARDLRFKNRVDLTLLGAE